MAVAAVLVAVTYPLVFALNDADLAVQLPFAIIPVGLAAWVFRWRVALVVVVVETVSLSVILRVRDGAMGWPIVEGGGIPTVLLIIVVAVSIGFLRQLRDDLTQRASEAEALTDATAALVAGAAARETMQGILSAAVGAVPSVVAAFIASDASGELLHVAATIGGPPEYLGRPYPVGTGVTGRAWRTGEIQRIGNVLDDPEYIGERRTSLCALAVPIIREGRTRGVLYFERDPQEPYTPRDIRILGALAGYAWIALRSEEGTHALGAATDRFAAAFSAAPSSLIISRAIDSTIVDVNDAFVAVIGRPRGEIVGRTLADLGLVDAQSGARITEQFSREHRLSGITLQTDRIGPGTRHFQVSAETVDIGGEAHVVWSATEVTEAKRAALANERLALYDDLTDLPNRNLFAWQVEAALEAATPSGRPVAVLLIDLDHFKDVNDTFGHGFGDRLLRTIGTRIRAIVPANETVARLGGDEFAIMLDAGAPDALRVADSIRRTLETPVDLEGHAIGVSASIGISFFPEHGDTESALLRRADIALYAAKATGGGTMVYAAAIDAHSPARLALTAELQRAIAADELILHYQPVMALHAGLCNGVEALVRWPHRERGLVPPADFIPAAERSGLIRPLTDWVVGRALAQGSGWRVGPDPVDIAVNISMRNLMDPSLPVNVARHIAAQGIDPARVCLEITESVAMADPERTISVLMQLHDIGVHIAIDDFGTGHSSLSYLRRIPVHSLKIDRTFIAGLAHDPASRSIVKATIELGHALGLVVVAEGIEHQEELDAARELGCDQAQGYFIARPMSEADVPLWLAAHAGAQFERDQPRSLASTLRA
ncbi:MAG TPA: EAL domain-containing protein [Candidatus Saccharimonadales bacterium]|nr:EAL domain-containing protein [Candidatus Saccharimonadales bacterium]